MPEIKLAELAVKEIMATESEVMKLSKEPTYPIAIKKPIGEKKTGGLSVHKRGGTMLCHSGRRLADVLKPNVVALKTAIWGWLEPVGQSVPESIGEESQV